MRLNDSPRLLILTQATWGPNEPGQWRFRVDPVDGGQGFEAAGGEPGCNRDRLDLWAVVRGLESLDQPSHSTLITASNYVSRGFRFGLTEWRERDWCWEKYGRWTEIRDADLWRRVDIALNYHQVDCRFWSLAAAPVVRRPENARSRAEQDKGAWSGLWRRLRRLTSLPPTPSAQLNYAAPPA